MSFSMNKIETNYTKTLSDYVENLKYEDIPAEVLERAKMIALQTIGVSIGAKKVPIAENANTLGLQMNGGEGGKATAWITGDKMCAANASLVNGTLADALDWEDCSWTGHPSASIIPVAWAMAEEYKKSGKDFLTAIVAAYEVYQRISMVVQPPKDWDVFKGWGLTSWQVFGGTVAACKILGLDSDKVNQALGISAIVSVIPSVLAHNTMSEIYHFEHGFRSRDGIQAALAAQNGIKNARNCFDDQYAYAFHMTEAFDESWYLKGLGEDYLIMTTLMKHWPANMWVQTPLEAAYLLAEKYDIKPDDVEEIIIDPATFGRMTLEEDGYETMMLAQFSIPYVISAMLRDRTPSADWYSEENLKNPGVLALAKKIHGSDGEMQQLMDSFAKFRAGTYPKKVVTIKTKDGNSYSQEMDCHPGHPANMMSREEFIERFRLQTAGVLSEEKAEKAIDVLCSIEEYDDLSLLGDLFTV